MEKEGLRFFVIRINNVSKIMINHTKLNETTFFIDKNWLINQIPNQSLYHICIVQRALNDAI